LRTFTRETEHTLSSSAKVQLSPKAHLRYRVLRARVGAIARGVPARSRAHYWAYRGDLAALKNRDSLTFSPNLGIVVRPCPSLDEAADHYAMAVELSPDDAGYWARYGEYLGKSARTSEAIAAFRRALELNPTVAKWQIALADLVRSDGSSEGYEESLRIYRAILDRDPRNSTARSRYVRLASRWGFWDEALSASHALNSRLDPWDGRVEEVTRYLLDTDQIDKSTVVNLISDLMDQGARPNRIWWENLQHRLQSVGLFELSYRMKDHDLVHRVAHADARTRHSLDDGLGLAIAFCNHDQPEKALAALQKIDVTKLTEFKAQVLEHRIAEVELLCGNARPIQAIQRVLETRLALPNEKRFRDMIEGRTIALVGPSVATGGSGQQIDASDVVVRTKYSEEDAQSALADHIGRRTDVAYYADRDAVILKSSVVDLLDRGQLSMAVFRPLTFSPSTLQRDDLATRTGMRFYREDLRAYGSAPLGIQRILMDLLRFAPASIKVHNVDFFTGATVFRAGYRDNAKQGFHDERHINDWFVTHDLRANFSLSRRLRDEGLVSFDEVGNAILDLTIEQYLQLLEERRVPNA
jgi:tetratricopeptide (TPR) repeat protein